MTHEEVIELLPWYANRTLDAGEERAVADHLTACAPCAKELEQYRMIQLAVAESVEEIPEPSKDMLRRAMGEIQHYEQAKAESASVGVVFGLTGWLSRLGDWLFGWTGPAPVLARALAGAQFVVVVALAGALAWSLLRGGEFQTASGKGPGQGAGTTISVKFTETITEAQLRQAITDIGARIVDGPSALGIYKIEVPIDPKQTEVVEKVVQELRQKSALITYAEKSD